MHTLKECHHAYTKRLKDAGINNPERVSRVFLRHVTGLADADFIARPETAITPEHQEELEKLVARRLAGEPVSRIMGERGFWSLSFKVTPAVLDPRPDTETLIEAALKRYADKPPERILDLGTGSGCILISLLHEWNQARGTGVDISPEALAVARENAVRNHVDNRVDFVCADWGEGVEGSFDLIVSNPPYIPNQEIPNLSPEVKNHDPILALAGGDDGLESYKKIMPVIKKLLKSDGCALLEMGWDQQEKLSRIVRDAGFTLQGVHADLAGIPRVVEISFGENIKKKSLAWLITQGA